MLGMIVSLIIFAGIALLPLLNGAKNPFFLKCFSLFLNGIVLCQSLVLLVSAPNSKYLFQEVTDFHFNLQTTNLVYSFGVDSIASQFIFLSVLLTFLCLLFLWDDARYTEYAFYLLLIQLFLIIVFSTLNILIFYVFFEAILIPMYLLIGIWGSRERKIRASYLFFYYTLCGSLPMLIGILYIYMNVGSLNLEYVMAYQFTFYEQCLLWLSFFFSFASKVPMFPLHIWLPEAHVEAPTVGSVLLAGILLKLGVYGFVRYSLTLFPDASIYFSPIIFVFSLAGIIYASFSALRQTDIKRIIAYSSVAHMNLVVLGIFSANVIGIEGAILQSLSHGFVSGGLFFLIGMLYNRYHSRFLYYYGGLVHLMPLYSSMLLILTMANIALPSTSSFVGEFLLLLGIFKLSSITGTIATLGVILSGAYSLWLYNRVVFGNIKNEYMVQHSDINLREFLVLLILTFFVFLLGVYPQCFLSMLHMTVTNLSFQNI